MSPTSVRGLVPRSARTSLRSMQQGSNPDPTLGTVIVWCEAPRSGFFGSGDARSWNEEENLGIGWKMMKVYWTLVYTVSVRNIRIGWKYTVYRLFLFCWNMSVSKYLDGFGTSPIVVLQVKHRPVDPGTMKRHTAMTCCCINGMNMNTTMK